MRVKSRLSAFTLMELLVVVAIIIVLAALAYTVFAQIRRSADKATALNNMRQLASAMAVYASQHEGQMAFEDTAGKDGWDVARQPTSDSAWYNALPRQLKMKGVGDFAKEENPSGFYSRQNILYLPGAPYPAKHLDRPYFAYAINTKLFRKGPDGKKPNLHLAAVQYPTRTVLFLEQGLPNELRAHPTIGKRDYDGSPKGSAKSFVTRYNERGIVVFIDGSAGEFQASQLLTANGEIWWAPESSDRSTEIYWTADPKEDPNRAAQM